MDTAKVKLIGVIIWQTREIIPYFYLSPFDYIILMIINCFFQRNIHTNSHSCFCNINFFFNSHDRYKIDQVINEMGVNASESDIEILKQVCTAVSIRAARLAAAGIAGIVKV